MSHYAVVDLIAHHARSSPDKLATVELPSGRRQTYEEMHERVGRLAAYIKSLGIGEGDRVGFLALNSIDILDLVFAVWRLGGIVLALNFRLTAAELSFIIEDASPKVVLVDGEFAAVAEELKGQGSAGHWIGFDGAGGDSEFERDIASAAGPILTRIPQKLEDP